MTKTRLAKIIGVTPQAIAQYESGINVPAPEHVHTIADELHFDSKFFYDDDLDQIPLDGISFRSRRAMTAAVRDRTLACSHMAASLVSFQISRRFRLPASAVPDLTTEQPQIAADFLRAHWQLGRGPVASMLHVLEAHGVEVYWFDEESPHVDAVSFWRDDKPFILVSQRMRGGERVRFDLAHELGHLVLHRNVVELDSRDVEMSANQFAAAFLLPERQFRLECPMFPTLRQFLQLKPRWKTSIQAMIYRSRELGLLSVYHYQRLFKDLSAKGWRTSEPCQIAYEESAIHRDIFERLASRDIWTDDIAAELHIRTSDLCTLIPVAKYYCRVSDETPAWKPLTIEELGYESNPKRTQLPSDRPEEL